MNITVRLCSKPCAHPLPGRAFAAKAVAGKVDLTLFTALLSKQCCAHLSIASDVAGVISVGKPGACCGSMTSRCSIDALYTSIVRCTAAGAT